MYLNTPRNGGGTGSVAVYHIHMNLYRKRISTIHGVVQKLQLIRLASVIGWHRRCSRTSRVIRWHRIYNRPSGVMVDTEDTTS